MRLEKIKVSGFKSFVDPTTAEFPTNLVGVVGPNGCGKSNIIDAVRWVMGESSAKMLRGESMADVIFNGSANRKPVGTAIVELIFDNSDGAAGGQFASYAHISVKRQVTRDGQSAYYLNNVRCRRRDITDLFLGTGLGPRSYSIIEQGMISRLIEARPEELRVYLEEAAGISKYKERRRETENRIRHTRENLERLDDLIEEVTKQLKHLERQSATAERYKKYKAEERQLKGELLILKWQSLNQNLQQRERQIAEQENKLEAAISGQRKVEAEIESLRADHTDANDSFNEVQGRFYALGAEIARLEQAIQFARETRAQQQADLDQIESSLQQVMHDQAQDKERLTQLTATIDEKSPQLESNREEESALLEQLAQAEQSLNQWQIEWDEFNQKANEPAQAAQVERTRINHLEQQEQNLQRRIERNQEEQGRLKAPDLQSDISRLEKQEQELAARSDELQKQLDAGRQQIIEQREQQTESANRLAETRSRSQGIVGRLSSLEALQQAAEEEGEQGKNWLNSQGLSNAERLSKQLDVDADWRLAIETVLGHHLQAVCVDDLGGHAASIEELEGVVELIETGGTPVSSGSDSLASKIRSSLNLGSLLAGIRVVDSTRDAMAKRASLSSGESLVTPEGVWIGSNWIRFGRPQGSAQGILEREEEIRELTAEQEEIGKQVEQLAQSVETYRNRLREAEHGQEELQQSFNSQARQLADVRSQLSGKRTRAEHMKNRLEALEQEGHDLERQALSGRESAEESRRKLHEALEVIETLGAARESLVQKRDSLRQNHDSVRQEATAKRQQVHELALQLESNRSQQQALQQNRERMQAQIEQMTGRRENLVEALAEGDAPVVEQQGQLESRLQSRLSVESELNASRKRLEDLDAGLRQKEQQRHNSEQAVQRERSILEQERMGRQEITVRAKTLEEQLNEGSYDRDELQKQLPEEATTDIWQEKVDKMAARIQRLGPINLAAIDEFKEQSERIEYLNSQREDVTKSLETLEEAIRKIDRETRTRFKDTFEKVNSGIKELFPKLFGGGHAYLEMTGEDLLDTGVTVMARPPGKRNSSIHLLSGGEKALTAVAMVFSIFRLNPAPFCMLDEVDAPLDDANVGRFCDMVGEMADQVQFIFITHNKITMEMSNQLQGVTMHEPGVSRLVSVDVEEAAQMAAM